MLARDVHIHRGNAKSLHGDCITLRNEQDVPANLILCGTGWTSSYPFLNDAQAGALGLPHPPELDTKEQRELWRALLDIADQKVLADYSYLKNPPQYRRPTLPANTTARLYNCIASLKDDSIVFLGRAHLSNSFRTAEAQAIWATAYFDGNVKLPPRYEMQQRVAYMNALSRRRYPTKGADGDYLFFELISYTDRLMEEAGLCSHRRGWWSDLVNAWHPITRAR